MHKAEELSRITIMREPSNPIYLDTYGWIMYQLGDCQSALFYLERAIENSGEKVEKEIETHYKEVNKHLRSAAYIAMNKTAKVHPFTEFVLDYTAVSLVSL